MKLIRSIRRELVLLTRSFYFYVEIAVALVFLAVLLFVLPENFDQRATEYTFFNMPAAQARQLEKTVIEGLGSATAENVTLKSQGREIPARYYTTSTKTVYVVDSEQDLIALTEDTGRVGTMVTMGENGPHYDYYLQGNETQRFENYATLLVSADYGALLEKAGKQPVQTLEASPKTLTDRQSMLPLMLTVNCVLMGILVAAANMIEDKSTRVIRAMRVVPAPIRTYLTAKMAAVLLISLLTCLILTIPVMGLQANYLMLVLIVLCGGFFTVSAGALLASFFSDMAKAFASVYILLMILVVPALLSLMPFLDLFWVKLIPSYYVLQSIRLALLGQGFGYILLCCGAFAAGGLALAAISVQRYQKAGMGG